LANIFYPAFSLLKLMPNMPNATRIGDQTTSGARIIGPGISHIQILGKAAAVQGDFVQGSTFKGNITQGSSRILIAGRAAAYVDCSVAGNNPQTKFSAETTISTGANTVQYINP
jgi:uncharacterized Zn-binding protein involved in type VI secretion